MRIVGLVLRAVFHQLPRRQEQRQLLTLRQSLRDVVDRPAANPYAVKADGAVREPRRGLVADGWPLHFLPEGPDSSERPASFLRVEEPKSQHPNPKSQNPNA